MKNSSSILKLPPESTSMILSRLWNYLKCISISRNNLITRYNNKLIIYG